ncbi:hypothetical protein JYB64_26155, partial [Algoriphagus aestuarii]|nr:hypothetical protein [Algoriphagus aestuarii]
MGVKLDVVASADEIVGRTALASDLREFFLERAAIFPEAGNRDQRKQFLMGKRLDSEHLLRRHAELLLDGSLEGFELPPCPGSSPAR